MSAYDDFRQDDREDQMYGHLEWNPGFGDSLVTIPVPNSVTLSDPDGTQAIQYGGSIFTSRNREADHTEGWRAIWLLLGILMVPTLAYALTLVLH